MTWSLIDNKMRHYVLSPIYVQRKMGFLIIQVSLFALNPRLKAVSFSNNDLEENRTRHLYMIFSLSLNGKSTDFVRRVYRSPPIEYPKPPTGNNASEPASKKLFMARRGISVFCKYQINIHEG